MSNVIETIVDTKKSSSYIKYNNYHQNNIFGITKLSRWELLHSNFIAWLLDDKSALVSNHGQIYKFVLMLYNIRNSSFNDKARIDENTLLNFLNDDFIKSVEVQREYNNIDILIEITTKDKILPIIIENKVDSKENGKHGDQTTVYFNFAEKKYSDRKFYYEPIYIFLSPAYNKTTPKQKEFMHVRYQNLVDYVIEPILKLCQNENSRSNIKTYLQCLSFQNDNEKGDKIMAISSEEKKIIDDFISENRNLISIVIESLDDVPDEVKEKLKTSVRDNTYYEFEGIKGLGKGRLVLEVVKKYCNDNNPKSYSELEKVFPKSLRGTKKGKGVIALESTVSDKDKGIGPNSHRRYFVDDAIKLTSGEKVLVCTEWGIGNIKPFIDYTRDTLKYDINEYTK